MSSNHSHLPKGLQDLVEGWVEHSSLPHLHKHENEKQFKERKTLEFHALVDKTSLLVEEGIHLILQSGHIDKKNKEEILSCLKRLADDPPKLKEGETLRCALSIPDLFFEEGFHRGSDFLNHKETLKAQSIFLSLTLLDSINYLFPLCYGIALAEENHHEEALLAYEHAFPIAGNGTPILLLWVVDSLKALGRNEEARSLCLEVLAAVKDLPDYQDIKIAAEKKLAEQMM